MKHLPVLLLIVLCACQGTKTPAASVALFNGQNLKGWHWDVPALDGKPDAKAPFFLREGLLVSAGEPGGHLITDSLIADYRVEFSYRFAGKPGNCGVLVHVSKPRRLYGMFPQSIEVQLKHTEAGDFWCIGEDIKVPDMRARRGPKKDWGVDGDKNRRITNLTGNVENPVGEWNTMKIEYLKRKIKVWLNGRLVNYGYRAPKGLGQLALQSEGAEVEFKNIRLTPITKLTK